MMIYMKQTFHFFLLAAGSTLTGMLCGAIAGGVTGAAGGSILGWINEANGFVEFDEYLESNMRLYGAICGALFACVGGAASGLAGAISGRVWIGALAGVVSEILLILALGVFSGPTLPGYWHQERYVWSIAGLAGAVTSGIACSRVFSRAQQLHVNP
jgi:hypothetical protein